MSERYDPETGEIDIGLHGPLLGSAEVAELWTALFQAQALIEAPQRTKEATIAGTSAAGQAYSYKYKYAPLDEVIAKIRKPFADGGLGFQQFITSRGTQHVVRTVIFHKSGQWTGIDYPIFYDAKKGAQGFASGVTMARRYGLNLAVGLAPEDDDDANVADARPATIASGGRTAPKSTASVTSACRRKHPRQRGLQAAAIRNRRDRQAQRRGAAARV